MKNWETLQADVNMIIGKHYTAGRSGNTVKFIVLHHNAGNLTVQQCYEVWQTREASAHYQVQADGTIGQLVWDKDTAWHAGNWNANVQSIGIEHADDSSNPWHISEATLDNGAHLVAALCKYYKLGAPHWGVNVFPHSHFSATACPASIGADQNAAYMQRAQAYYAQMTGTSTVAAAPQPAATSNFGGTYRCNVAALNIRTAPTVSAPAVGTYKSGQTVILDNWYKIADGYVWGRYTAYSGNMRYIAVGKATGKVEANDYLIKM